MIRTLGCLPALIRPPFRCSTVPLQARARNGTTTATLRVIYPATNLGPGRATQHQPPLASRLLPPAMRYRSISPSDSEGPLAIHPRQSEDGHSGPRYRVRGVPHRRLRPGRRRDHRYRPHEPLRLRATRQPGVPPLLCEPRRHGAMGRSTFATVQSALRWPACGTRTWCSRRAAGAIPAKPRPGSR